MKKTTFILGAGALVATLLTTACTDANMQKNADGNYVVNTSELGKDVKGWAGNTPLQVTIGENGTIVKVEALPNSETPDFFREVETKMIGAYAGIAVADAEKVDGVSGATFSSRAVKENMKIAVDYWKSKK